LLSEDSAAGEMLPTDGWSDGQKRIAGSQSKFSHISLLTEFFVAYLVY